jgi:hypothetical protein
MYILSLPPTTLQPISRSVFKLLMYAVTPLFDVSERAAGKNDKCWKISVMGKLYMCQKFEKTAENENSHYAARQSKIKNK